MNAFIAWTPLHIINILNTKSNFFNTDKNDLYIYDEFEDASNLYYKIKDMKLFNDVFFINPKQLDHSVKRFFYLIFDQNPFALDQKIYDNIFIQGDNYFAKTLYSFSKNNNPNVRLNYIEDGIGAYVGSNILDKEGKYNQLISILNKHSIYRAEIDNYFLYAPELINSSDTSKIKVLPKLKENILSTVKEIFDIVNFVPQSENEGQFIFLDQPFKLDGHTINEVEIFNLVEQYIGVNKDYKIKMHPRSNPIKYKTEKLLDTNLPWELYCLRNSDEELTVISIASTACFTPALMFNQSIKVVFLAEFVLNYYDKKLTSAQRIWLRNAIKFAGEIKQTSNKQVIIPKNEIDLKKALL